MPPPWLASLARPAVMTWIEFSIDIISILILIGLVAHYYRRSTAFNDNIMLLAIVPLMIIDIELIFSFAKPSRDSHDLNIAAYLISHIVMVMFYK